MDAMLDGLTPQQFNEWVASYIVDPRHDDWSPAAKICETVYNAVQVLACAIAGVDVTESMLMTAEEFLPTAEPKKKRKRQYVDDMAEQHAMKLRYGNK